MSAMFNYYTVHDAEQIRFYQLPKELVKHERFKGISDSAKILYSLLRDRVTLSVKNNWVDELGRVYIIFTLAEIMEDLGCADQKATKSMKELQKIGLVESVRRGLGKPNLIYVKNFATGLNGTDEGPENPEKPVAPQNRENHESGIVNTTNQESLESRSLIRENHEQSILTLINNNSIDTESESMSTSDSADAQKNDRTPTMTPDVIKEENKNEKGLLKTAKAATANSLQSPRSASSPTYDYNTYRSLIQENIDYDHYLVNRRSELDQVDELIECMLDVICTGGETVKIGGEEKNRQMVISQYLKITSEEIDHILMKFQEQHHRITHTNSYLKTMLYTIRQEMGHHYTNAVRADGVVW